MSNYRICASVVTIAALALTGCHVSLDGTAVAEAAVDCSTNDGIMAITPGDRVADVSVHCKNGAVFQVPRGNAWK